MGKSIGFGFFCFGDDYYYQGTKEKMNKIIEMGFESYVLTENRDEFIYDFKSDRKSVV